MPMARIAQPALATSKLVLTAGTSLRCRALATSSRVLCPALVFKLKSLRARAFTGSKPSLTAGASATCFRNYHSEGCSENHERSANQDAGQHAHSHGLQNACWKCEATITHCCEFFCSSCGTVQQPGTNCDHFEVLNQPRQFDIDVKQLEARFKSLQARLHPDRFHTLSQEEVGVAQEQSSAINVAYGVLRIPHLRGKYLLELLGQPIQEGDNHVDPALLMEVMELRQEVAEGGPEVCERVLKDVKKVQQSYEKQAAAEFEEGKLSEAKSTVIALQYYHRIEEACVENL